MLTRRFRHLIAIVGLLAFLTAAIFLFGSNDNNLESVISLAQTWSESEYLKGRTKVQGLLSGTPSKPDYIVQSPHVHLGDETLDLEAYGKPVHEVFSNSTKNGKYFTLVTGVYESYNPSILAHESKEGVWWLVAQQERTDVVKTVWFAQLVCEAAFNRAGSLVCIKPPLILPIGVTATEHSGCEGEIAHMTFNVGPHDARAFYGPNAPYAVYGSQSQFSCFGIWISDLRFLTDWGIIAAAPGDPNVPYKGQTELQRPEPYGEIEKNWFLFWDKDDQLYAHYDTSPKRVLAKLYRNGSSGPDLAGASREQDEQCMARLMPHVAESLESIHQATNSLSITLCKRADPDCKPNDDNTFIMHIFHWKSFYFWHGEYEPYVMLFRRSAPFEVYGITKKPIWIHGRDYAPRPPDMKPEDRWTATQMFYVTSISWKGSSEQGQRYHGYLDDIMFLGFGIEDTVSAAIDVVASDLLVPLGLCSDQNATTERTREAN